MKLFNEFSSLIEDILRKKQYIGQCDKLRCASDSNEEYWHIMMKNRKNISIQDFLNGADMSALLDDDETPEQFVNDAMRQDPEAGAYESVWGDKPCMFFQTAGFEFIFI
jgi:hypothetical protein